MSTHDSIQTNSVLPRVPIVSIVAFLSVFLIALPAAADVLDSIKQRIAGNEQIGGHELTIEMAAPGHVKLIGNVASKADKMKIEKIARSHDEVQMVTNNLRVMPQKWGAAQKAKKHHRGMGTGPLTDANLHERVIKTLRHTEGVTMENLSISVNDGVVSVSGDREKHEEIDHILANILMVQGVKDIKSTMTINGRPYTDKDAA